MTITRARPCWRAPWNRLGEIRAGITDVRQHLSLERPLSAQTTEWPPHRPSGRRFHTSMRRPITSTRSVATCAQGRPCGALRAIPPHFVDRRRLISQLAEDSSVLRLTDDLCRPVLTVGAGLLPAPKSWPKLLGGRVQKLHLACNIACHTTRQHLQQTLTELQVALASAPSLDLSVYEVISGGTRPCHLLSTSSGPASQPRFAL